MASKSRVTIEDVAEVARVSRQTVSRVINRGPNVKPEVKERVEQAIAELGYVPNLSARRMGGGKSFLIMAINDRQRTLENWEAGSGNDWVDQMLYGGMTECEKHGYALVFRLIDAERDKARKQLSDVLSSIMPDGVILTPPHSANDDLVELLKERGIACARVGKRDGGHCVDVAMHEEAASAEATRLLLETGHRRLAYLAGADGYGPSRRRVEAFRETVSAECADCEMTVLDGQFSFEIAVDLLNDVLAREDRPTGIIADNDQMAFAAMHVADRLGIQVPEALSVITFEDTPGVRFSVPPLTAIRQPTAAMIAKACEKLIEIRRDGGTGDAFILPHRLVERDSTMRRPGG
ncbi:LacI family DNA-binding transcriptional regulator [Paraurantiacibacter namhicola]|uniref:Putative HTH-type transcriptional repressor ExuR n=1 Tax=Paraurantiacibacter namhicola TaxID=645517 RepID=A0A1C7D7A4_9SPHN|nr:LacI family DNA-binding transcriptional regulator [Paraurantiacibacter namhicola]ANU07350.1 putative HTH-type transcriptional repressor ExuR [Paraurantiacibacter namhicola]